MKIIAIVLIAITVSSISCANLVIQKSNDQNRLSKFVCNLVKDVLKSSNDTQDVFIADLRKCRRLSSSFNIEKCLSDISSVVITDFKKPMAEKSLRMATVLILEFETVSTEIIQSIVNTLRKESVWNHMAKVISIVPTSTDLRQRLTLLAMLKICGFLDVAVIYQTTERNIRYEIFPSLLPKLKVGTDEANTSLIFPDKLKNMQGHQLNIVLHFQSPRIKIYDHQVSTPLLHFLSILKESRNGSLNISVLTDYTNTFKQFWLDRKLDLTLNTILMTNTSDPRLLTYEEDSYCVLAPLPTKIPISRLIFIEPFDGFTWLCLMLTISACVVVWWMFYGRGAVDSPWLLAYGMFVMLIGQGVDFSRRNRLVLVILLQLIIAMIFILNNLYEGAITSFMITPTLEDRFDSFDDVLASKYKIIVDEFFASLNDDNDDYNMHRSRMIIRNINATDTLSEKILEHQSVIVLKCDVAEHYINNKLMNGLMLLDHYYFLPIKMMPSLIRLEASYFNPYIRMLQQLMDLCFEAGLPQIWKIFEYEATKSISENSTDATYLQLKDLVQVFSILFIGYGLSFLILLIEIFFHDMLSRLKLAYLARKLRNKTNQIAYRKRKQPHDVKYQKGALYYIIHRHQKLKRLKSKRLKVREIFVQPRTIAE